MLNSMTGIPTMPKTYWISYTYYGNKTVYFVRSNLGINTMNKILTCCFNACARMLLPSISSPSFDIFLILDFER